MAKVVYYSGMVQGVGFRATAEMIARHHPIRGWVRIAFHSPLGIEFEIIEDDKKVLVLSVWSIG